MLIPLCIDQDIRISGTAGQILKICANTDKAESHPEAKQSTMHKHTQHSHTLAHTVTNVKMILELRTTDCRVCASRAVGWWGEVEEGEEDEEG